MSDKKPEPISKEDTETAPSVAPPTPAQDKPIERGGPRGPEPTRFGDWEQKGRCSDF